MEQAAVKASGGSGGGAGLLTVMEAAHELRLGYAATLAAIKRGQLPAVRLGKAYRLRAEDVRAVVTPVGGGQAV